MKIKTGVKEKEAGAPDLDPSSQRALGIRRDKDVLSAEQQALVRKIRSEFVLTDFTTTNNAYGPASGISPGERLIRAYKLGLLRAKPKK